MQDIRSQSEQEKQHSSEITDKAIAPNKAYL